MERQIPNTGYLRLSQILGNAKTPPLIPVGKSTWWAGVKSGRYPKPVKLSERCTAWRAEDILSLIQKLAEQAHLHTSTNDRHDQ